MQPLFAVTVPAAQHRLPFCSIVCACASAADLTAAHPLASAVAAAVRFCSELFAALDRCEAMLGSSRYLVGNTLTEADVRLFMTLIRFDHVSWRAPALAAAASRGEHDI
jgi:glutathione S-transferase